MKYIIGLMLLIMSTSSFGSAQEQSIRDKIVCKDGYKYLYVWIDVRGDWRPPTVVQMYKAGDGALRPSQPIKCK